jgi:outer membrane biosynthesis protein TonB
MPATEIPPKRPLPPPPPQLEGSDLYDAQRWEKVYRELHTVPELLVQLQDDLSRARKREAFWISVICHLVLAILLVNSQRFAGYFPQSRVIIAKPGNEKELTYLELPPDQQQIKNKPDTNKISDKNRIATKRTPDLDREELKKILDAARRGAPGMSAPAQAQPQQQQPQQQAEAQPQPQQQPAQTPPDNNPAALHAPQQQAAPPKPSFSTGNMSAGSAVEQAARSAIGQGPHIGGNGGDYGLGQGRQATKALGNLDVLSDTMGVDFGPYLQRVLHDVKVNWYNLIPESARPPLMKKGKVSIEFAIMKNGTVQGMTLSGPSGDVSLDRAAWGGITNSAPFPGLPTEFRGDYLLLRFNFYYNPEGSDLN